MEQLKNIDHTFDTALGDVGCTIRKGSKWYEESISNELELRNCPRRHDGVCNSLCHHAGTGKVIGRWKGSLLNLPPALLAMEHNIQARDPEKLRVFLEQGYGKICNEDTVTALIYIRTEKKEEEE
ncbi:hypothetical protein LCGC14_1627260 [marine sediment metagenome]|uniref:Uncharacterized protein n=1 Tax=marine sediment metagenome TaxID=412755 RepID=A0A0F9KJB9_9ZZZZ